MEIMRASVVLLFAFLGLTFAAAYVVDEVSVPPPHRQVISVTSLGNTPL